MNSRSRDVGAVASFAMFALLIAVPPVAFAQVAPPAPLEEGARTRIRIRGLELNPTVSMSNVGMDNNVFNSIDDPQKDFTATFSPALDAWARFGRTRVRARGRTDLVYFSRFESERSVDGGIAARFEFPFNRVVPWLEGGSFSGRQRVGYEIDLRSRRTQNDAGLGVDVRVAPKTTVGLGLRRSTTQWDGSMFLGNSLQDALNRGSNSATLSYRQRLTALTTFAIDASATTDRFDRTPARDTDSVSIVTGFDLAARALISGTVRVGVKKVDPLGGAFSGFKGVVAKATMGYSLRGTTRIEAEMGRETYYSFDALYPFFVQTGVNGTVTQGFAVRWDAQLRFGRQNLAYKPLAGGTDLLTGRMDRFDQRGFGAGYRLNRSARIGVTIDRVTRKSPIQIRDYKAYRTLASVTYVG